MKFFKKIFLIILILSMNLSVSSCAIVSSINKSIWDRQKQEAELESRIEKQKEKTEETTEEITEETTEETTEEETTKEKSEEELIEEIALIFAELKEEVRKVIEDDFGGKLTKFVYDRDNDTFYLAYNSMWASENTMKKEIFDIVSFYALADCFADLDVVATNDFGKSYHSYTKNNILIKIKNYEISYEDWLDEAFLK